GIAVVPQHAGARVDGIRGEDTVVAEVRHEREARNRRRRRAFVPPASSAAAGEEQNQQQSSVPHCHPSRGQSFYCYLMKLSKPFYPASAGPLREGALEHRFGDAVFEYFYRSTRDHPAAAAPQTVLDQLFLGVAEAAHHLQRLVRHVEPCLVAERLGDRG